MKRFCAWLKLIIKSEKTPQIHSEIVMAVLKIIFFLNLYFLDFPKKPNIIESIGIGIGKKRTYLGYLHYNDS